VAHWRSVDGVGPAMAVALVATMYGIAFANFILIPLGENLAKHNRTDKTVRAMVIDGIKLIRLKKHPLLVEENIKSYLLPSERDLVAQAIGSDQQEEAA
ncbi:MAG: MotA/TolQ/ExbB proton channel family protein, partial [Pseudomonadota bacterium]